MIRSFVLLAVVIAGAPAIPGPAMSAQAAEPDFAREIRPLLADRCFACHGPDAKARQAGLRLDERVGALAKLESGAVAIVPGRPTASELVARIVHSDPEQRMPPAKSGKHLSAAEIDLLKRWIAAGAPWQEHWSFVPPRRPPLPKLTPAARSPATNAIDLFLLAKMEEAGEPAAFSPEADRATLLRRLSWDLTGVPPTPAEVAAFLADRSPDAYERQVDRLLASPRFGERMALGWLDLARYADTHGYHADSQREMSRWRDYVIESFNRDVPYDRFTIEQLAGDLLPSATLEQRIATGFNRNHMINYEAGIIPEEYRHEYVSDRVATTAAVWLGLTVGCARCHDHKFDPVSQRDYYRLFAYFNNLPENGLDGRSGNAAPFLKAPTPKQAEQQRTLATRADLLTQQVADRAMQAEPDQRLWEASIVAGREKLAGGLPEDAMMHLPLDESEGEKATDARHPDRPLAVAGKPQWVKGKFVRALLFDGETSVDGGDRGDFDKDSPFTLAAWLFPTTRDQLDIASRAIEMPVERGWRIGLEEGRLTVRLTSDGERNGLVVQSKKPLPNNRWQHVAVTIDGSGKAAGIQLYVDGKPEEVEIVRNLLTGSIRAMTGLRIGGNGERRFRGMLDEVRLYARALSATEAAALAGADPVSEIVAIPMAQRTPRQAKLLAAYYLERHDPKYRELAAQLDEAKRAVTQLDRETLTVMVMSDDQPRDTFILTRGNYQRPTAKIAAGTPEAFPTLAAAPANRLGLAQWIVAAQNPLTARVAANRLWQQFFGAGLVRTPEDFGLRGERPTHPGLLDWLAVEYRDGGWDTKRMVRLLVTSRAYRQASLASAEAIARDPANRLVARMSRLPMPAELVRDAALSAGGLLDPRIGGPSVSPYQPGDLWKELSYSAEFSAQTFVLSEGPDLFRRGLYTFLKRSVPPPNMTALDAPDREVCTLTRSRMATPAAALVLLNDPVYVEAARAIAERVLREGGGIDATRLDLLARLILSRPLDARELALAQRLLASTRRRFALAPAKAEELFSIGEAPRDERLDRREVSTWTVLASTLLNLDEAIVRE